MTDDAQRPKTEASVHAPPAEVFAFQGFQLTILLSSGQTDGRFSMIEGLVPAGGDSGRHVQHREDETLLLTEGELEVTLGSSIVNLTAGQSYFAPRGTPHRIRNVGSEPARATVVTTPAGFDEFVRSVGTPMAAGVLPPRREPTPDDFAFLTQAAERFGIELLPDAPG